MKAAIEMACLALALSASAAFDSQRWHDRRDSFGRDVARLQAAYSNCVQHVDRAAENVKIPFEMFPDGSVKTTIFAKRAVFFRQEGLVWAADVTIRKFDRDGALVSQIDASRCVIDRMSKSGWVEGHARLRHKQSVIDGDGVYFSSPQSYVTVFRNTAVESTDLSFGGMP